MVGSDVRMIWYPVPVQPNRHSACPSCSFHVGRQRVADMHQLLWRAAGLPARLLKNRRVGFFDTDILSKDHKRETALQPASVGIAVPVRYKSEYVPAGDGTQHRQDIRVEFNAFKAMFEVDRVEVRRQLRIVAADRRYRAPECLQSN